MRYVLPLNQKCLLSWHTFLQKYPSAESNTMTGRVTVLELSIKGIPYLVNLLMIKYFIFSARGSAFFEIKKNSKLKSSYATALQGLGRQSGRRRSAKIVPPFADRGVSRGQRNGSPRPLISVYRTWVATYFIQAAPQLTSRDSRG